MCAPFNAELQHTFKFTYFCLYQGMPFIISLKTAICFRFLYFKNDHESTLLEIGIDQICLFWVFNFYVIYCPVEVTTLIIYCPMEVPGQAHSLIKDV